MLTQHELNELYGFGYSKEDIAKIEQADEEARDEARDLADDD